MFLQGNDALGGLKEVEAMLNKVSYSPELAHKIASHLQEIGRPDLVPFVYEDTRKIANLEEKEVEVWEQREK